MNPQELIAFLKSMALLSFLGGVVGAFGWQVFGEAFHWLAVRFRRRPAPPVELALLARRLRERAAVLDGQARTRGRS